MTTATSRRFFEPIYDGAAQAALDELSGLLRVRIDEITREGTEARRFWVRIGGQYLILPCDSVRRPRRLCEAFTPIRRDLRHPAPHVKPWLGQREARHVLSLMHQVADADPRSAKSAVSVRRGGGAR